MDCSSKILQAKFLNSYRSSSNILLEENIMSDWNQAVIEEFRANAGKVGGNFAKMDLLLLHTTGAKSGQVHVTPLVYGRDDDDYVIIASKGGAPTHPDWYHNLVTNPQVTVEVGIEKFQAQASVVAEPKRTALYDQMASRYAFFDEYRRKAGRVIPVIQLSRVE